MRKKLLSFVLALSLAVPNMAYASESVQTPVESNTEERQVPVVETEVKETPTVKSSNVPVREKTVKWNQGDSIGTSSYGSGFDITSTDNPVYVECDRQLPLGLQIITDDRVHSTKDTYNSAGSAYVYLGGKIESKVHPGLYTFDVYEKEDDNFKLIEKVKLTVTTDDNVTENNSIHFTSSTEDNIILKPGESHELNDVLSDRSTVVYITDKAQRFLDASKAASSIPTSPSAKGTTTDAIRKAALKHVNSAFIEGYINDTYKTTMADSVFEIRDGKIVAKGYGSALIWATDINHNVFKPIAINVRDSSKDMRRSYLSETERTLYQSYSRSGVDTKEINNYPAASFFDTTSLNKAFNSNVINLSINSRGYWEEGFTHNYYMSGTRVLDSTIHDWHDLAVNKNGGYGVRTQRALTTNTNPIALTNNFEGLNNDYMVHELVFWGTNIISKKIDHMDAAWFVTSQPLSINIAQGSAVNLKQGDNRTVDLSQFVSGGTGRLRFTAINIPAGTSVDIYGKLTGVPTGNEKTMSVRVTDLTGQSQTLTLSVVIEQLPPPAPPPAQQQQKPTPPPMPTIVEKKRYTISATKTGQGEIEVVSAAGSSYAYENDMIAINATPAEGYVVGSVTLDGQPKTTTFVSKKVTGNTTYNVEFIPKLKVKDNADTSNLNISQHIEGGKSPFKYELVSAPSGVTINNSTGQISITGSDAKVGTVQITDSSINKQSVTSSYIKEIELPEITVRDISITNRVGSIPFNNIIKNNGRPFTVEFLNGANSIINSNIKLTLVNDSLDYVIIDPTELDDNYKILIRDTSTGKVLYSTITINVSATVQVDTVFNSAEGSVVGVNNIYNVGDSINASIQAKAGYKLSNIKVNYEKYSSNGSKTQSYNYYTAHDINSNNFKYTIPGEALSINIEVHFEDENLLSFGLLNKFPEGYPLPASAIVRLEDVLVPTVPNVYNWMHLEASMQTNPHFTLDPQDDSLTFNMTTKEPVDIGLIIRSPNAPGTVLEITITVITNPVDASFEDADMGSHTVGEYIDFDLAELLTSDIHMREFFVYSSTGLPTGIEVIDNRYLRGNLSKVNYEKTAAKLVIGLRKGLFFQEEIDVLFGPTYPTPKLETDIPLVVEKGKSLNIWVKGTSSEGLVRYDKDIRDYYYIRVFPVQLVTESSPRPIITSDNAIIKEKGYSTYTIGETDIITKDFNIEVTPLDNCTLHVEWFNSTLEIPITVIDQLPTSLEVYKDLNSPYFSFDMYELLFEAAGIDNSEENRQRFTLEGNSPYSTISLGMMKPAAGAMRVNNGKIEGYCVDTLSEFEYVSGSFSVTDKLTGVVSYVSLYLTPVRSLEVKLDDSVKDIEMSVKSSVESLANTGLDFLSSVYPAGHALVISFKSLDDTKYISDLVTIKERNIASATSSMINYSWDERYTNVRIEPLNNNEFIYLSNGDYQLLEVTPVLKNKLALTEADLDVESSTWDIKHKLNQHITGGKTPYTFSIKTQGTKLAINYENALVGPMDKDGSVTLLAMDAEGSTLEFTLNINVPDPVTFVINNNEDEGSVEGVHEEYRAKVGDKVSFNVYANPGYQLVTTAVNDIEYTEPKVTDHVIDGDTTITTNYKEVMTPPTDTTVPNPEPVGGMPPYTYEVIDGPEQIIIPDKSILKLKVEGQLADGEYEVMVRATDSSPEPQSTEFTMWHNHVNEEVDWHTVYPQDVPGGFVDVIADEMSYDGTVYKVPDGAQVTVKAEPINGFKFDKWILGAKGTEEEVSLTVTDDIILISRFAEVKTTNVDPEDPTPGPTDPTPDPGVDPTPGPTEPEEIPPIVLDELITVEYGTDVSLVDHTTGGTAPYKYKKSWGNQNIVIDTDGDIHLSPSIRRGSYEITVQITDSDDTLEWVNTTIKVFRKGGEIPVEVPGGSTPIPDPSFSEDWVAPYFYEKIEGHNLIYVDRETGEITVDDNIPNGLYDIVIRLSDSSVPANTEERDYTIRILRDKPNLPNNGDVIDIKIPSDEPYEVEIDGWQPPFTWEKIAGHEGINIVDGKFVVEDDVPNGLHLIYYKITDSRGKFDIFEFKVKISRLSGENITIPSKDNLTGSEVEVEIPSDWVAPLTYTKISGHDAITVDSNTCAISLTEQLTNGVYPIEVKVIDSSEPANEKTFTIDVTIKEGQRIDHPEEGYFTIYFPIEGEPKYPDVADYMHGYIPPVALRDLNTTDGLSIDGTILKATEDVISGYYKMPVEFSYNGGQRVSVDELLVRVIREGDSTLKPGGQVDPTYPTKDGWIEPYTYTKVSGHEGLRVNSITGTITADDDIPEGNYTIVVKVTDSSNPAKEDTFNYFIKVRSGDNRPTIPGDITIDIYKEPSKPELPNLDDHVVGGRAPFTYEIVKGPEGVSISDNHLVADETVPAGRHEVVIRVTDRLGDQFYIETYIVVNRHNMHRVTTEVIPAEAGTIDVSINETAVSVNATAEEGYVFDKFVSNGTDVKENPHAFNSIGDTHVIAMFNERMKANNNTHANQDNNGNIDIDINDYFEGGTAPYTYELKEPAEGLNMSEEGKITGTVSENGTTIKVVVTDSSVPADSIEIVIVVNPIDKYSPLVRIIGKGTVHVDKVSYTEGEDATITAYPTKGYVFKHYEVNGQLHTNKVLVLPITGDVRVIVVFQKDFKPTKPADGADPMDLNNYVDGGEGDITFESDELPDGFNISDEDRLVVDDSIVKPGHYEIPIEAKDENGNVIIIIVEITIEDNTSDQLKHRTPAEGEDKMDLDNYVSGGKGKIEFEPKELPDGFSIDEDNRIVVDEDNVKPGNHKVIVDAKDEDGNTITIEVEVTIDDKGNTDVEEIKEFKVTSALTPSTAGVIELSDSVVKDGDVVTAEAHAYSGYEFVMWIIEGKEYDSNPVSHIVTKDVELVAIYRTSNEIDLDNLPSDTDKHPPIKGDEDSNIVDLDDIISGGSGNHEIIIIEIPEGVDYDEEEGTLTNNTGEDKTVVIQIKDGDKVIIVEIIVPKIPMVHVNISTLPLNSGTVSGNTTYQVGDVVTLTAIPNAGVEFAGWDVEGIDLAAYTSETISFVMPNRDVEVVAMFDDPASDEIPKGIWYRGVLEHDYTGAAIKPVIRVYDGTKLLREKIDYTLAYKNNKNAYTFTEDDSEFNGKKAPTIVLKTKGNYKGSRNIYFTINPIDINEVNGLTDIIGVTSNGKKVTVNPKLTWNNKKLAKKDFTVESISDNSITADGTYDMQIIGKGNFTGEFDFKLVVTTNKSVVPVSKLKVSKLPAMTYTGKALVPTDFTIKYNKDIPESDEYTVSFRNNVNIGKAELIITGTGKDSDKDGISYIGQHIVNYSIVGPQLKKATINGLEKSYTFTGERIVPDFYVVLEGKTLVRGKDYKIEATNNLNKGKATLIITALPGSNCSGSKKVSFTIKPEENFTVSLNSVSGNDFKLTKGGTKPSVTVYDGVTILEEGTDYTLSYKNNRKVANLNDKKAPTVVVTGKGNYRGKVSVNFNIIPTALSADNGIRLVVADKVESPKKGGYIQKFTIYDSDGKKLTTKEYDKNSVTYTVSGNDAPLTKSDVVAAGTTIKVTVQGKGSYAGGEVSATYKILPNGTDISKAKASIKPQQYTGKSVSINSIEQFKDSKVVLKSAGSSTELVFGKDFIVLEDSYVNNVKRGTAKVTIQGIGSYGGQKTLTFKIGQRTINDFWTGLIDLLDLL